MSALSVSDQDFETEVLQAAEPVVVDFWAEWCGPCKAMLPLVEELATEKEGSVKVVKVNIDQSPESPSRYGVRGIPTLMMFKGGQLVDTRVGGMSKAQLTEWVEGLVSPLTL